MAKFEISRTSVWGDAAPLDETTCERLGVKLERERESHWTIEVDDLPALLKLVDELGDLVLRGPLRMFDERHPHIEVYDDYRE